MTLPNNKKKLTFFTPPLNSDFIGRRTERETIEELQSLTKSRILIVYGRKRIGKTELTEQSFRNRNLLKFEGIEDKPQEIQTKTILYQLSKYTADPFLSRVECTSWLEVFDLIAEYCAKGPITLYLKELQ